MDKSMAHAKWSLHAYIVSIPAYIQKVLLTYSLDFLDTVGCSNPADPWTRTAGEADAAATAHCLRV